MSITLETEERGCMTWLSVRAAGMPKIVAKAQEMSRQKLADEGCLDIEVTKPLFTLGHRTEAGTWVPDGYEIHAQGTRVKAK